MSTQYHEVVGIAPERKARAEKNLALYQIKRRLINALEGLDCVEDATTIAVIVSRMPPGVWDKPDRRHWKK